MVVTHMQGDPEPEHAALSPWQRSMLEWYRNTCIAAGMSVLGSTLYWNFGPQQKPDIFVPPRAQNLPPDVVEAWKSSMVFREGVRTVGRQSLFLTGVAAVYFGVETAAKHWRDKQDWVNTAMAGAVSGLYLGLVSRSSARLRMSVTGAAAGSVLGAISGWTQKQLRAALPEV
eukprot:jgi/Chrzof1/5212/Cz15g16160.t1